MLTNKSIEARFKYFEEAIDEYDADGMVMFSNRSCRPQSIGQDETVEIVREKYGFPILIFEGETRLMLKDSAGRMPRIRLTDLSRSSKREKDSLGATGYNEKGGIG